jgi:hypothetical protein
VVRTARAFQNDGTQHIDLAPDGSSIGAKLSRVPYRLEPAIRPGRIHPPRAAPHSDEVHAMGRKPPKLDQRTVTPVRTSPIDNFRNFTKGFLWPG